MKKVLFVDDDKNVRQGLKRTLHIFRLDWEVIFAENGAQALELLEQVGFDAVVCDMSMPGISGLEVLRTVYENYPETIRFILSGMVDHETSLLVSRYAHQFFSKPCDSKVLIQALKRAFSLEEGQAKENLRKILSKIKKIPSLPSLYLEINNEIQSPNASLERIASIIERDPSMCAKILQLVNSAFFGVKQSIVDPFQATTFLGVDVIRGLILSAGVFSQFSPQLLKQMGIGALWEHSTLVGIYSRAIARQENQSNTIQGSAFTAGLLHDVGKMVLAENMSMDYFTAVGKSINNNVSLHLTELDVFGVTHAQIGAYLLGIWGLPDEMISAIECHHFPKDENCRTLLISAVYAANIIDHQLHVRNWVRKNPEADSGFLETSGIGEKIARWLGACRSIDT